MAKPSTSTFDYGGLDPESRIVIRQKTTEIHRLVKRAAADLVELGQLLLDVKDQLHHGQFGIWLAAEFEWNETTAQRYMRLARVFKSGTVPDLPVKALHLLAMPGTTQEARDEVQHRVDAGEHPSFEDVENIIEDVNAELFEALSPEQQLEVVRREEESALRGAPPSRADERTRRLKRVQRHAEKARNAAVSLRTEGKGIVELQDRALALVAEMLG